jgi:hypothetical protein
MSVIINIDKSILGDYSKDNISVEEYGNNVGECIDYIVKQQPLLKDALFNEKDDLLFNLFIVNGESKLFDILSVKVKDGDEITVGKLPSG